MTQSVVSINGLFKRYGSFPAVNGISLEINRGEIFGLLGPNGAGKTTTLECLEGLRKISGGVLRVAGCDPQTEERKLRQKLGVQLQTSSLPDSICVHEIMDLICTWHGIKFRNDLIEKFDMNALLKQKYRQLSTGQKRRLNLVLALVNDPEVLILDEPTAGLDVQSRVQLHEEIRHIKSQGITVLLATHDMAEAEQLCDRLAIIIHGKLAVCGTPAQVTSAGSKETRIRIRTSKTSLMPGTDIGGAVFVRNNEGYLEYSCREIAPAVSEILNKVQQSDDTVEDLRVERPSLEERFLELIEGENNI